MKLSLGITPCPNDTFSFYFFLKRYPQIKTYYLDIQTLNEKALKKENLLNITKLSFAIWKDIEEKYILLSSGSALGRVGPVAVSPLPLSSLLKQEEKIRIGIPGENTTAHFLLDFYLENKKEIPLHKIEKVFLLYSSIESALLEKEIHIGVLIHEKRFSYASQGLQLIEDLGEFYLQHTSSSYIPLGGIFLQKEHQNYQREIQEALQESIQKALESLYQKDTLYYREILPFLQKYAQDLSEEVIEKHIQTYVNEESISLSAEGKKSLEIFYYYLSQWKGRKSD